MEPQGGGPEGSGSTTSLSRRPCNSQTTGTTEKSVHWNGLSMSAHIWDQSCKLAVWKFCRCGRDCVSGTLRVVGLSVNICLKGECMRCLIILQLVSFKRNSSAHAVTQIFTQILYTDQLVCYKRALSHSVHTSVWAWGWCQDLPRMCLSVLGETRWWSMSKMSLSVLGKTRRCFLSEYNTSWRLVEPVWPGPERWLCMGQCHA